MLDLTKQLDDRDLAIISALERELRIKIPPAEDFSGLFTPPGGYLVEEGLVTGLGIVGEPIYDVKSGLPFLARN
ncbi:MAG TPA: hypothetical protein VKK79_25680 [Candidatus Lokiarchaeia archaeon]|nr:hypothetical protein [Candidatus Lokiarchaeia archaeon]